MSTLCWTLPAERPHWTLPDQRDISTREEEMSLHCEVIRGKESADVLIGAVDFTGQLGTGEKLTGTPTISADPGQVAIASPGVNTATTDINGRTVAKGKAVLFTVSGGEGGERETLSISVATTDGQTLLRDVLLDVLERDD